MAWKCRLHDLERQLAEMTSYRDEAEMQFQCKVQEVLDEMFRAEDAQAELARERERGARLWKALEAIRCRVPIMASHGEYRRGQMDALEACSVVARAALAEQEGGE